MELFPYQTVGAEVLAANSRFLLADDMGLGKSAQAIRAADKLGLKKLLVVCPAIARINWSRELVKFGLVKRVVDVILDGKKPIPADAETVIVNYDLLAKRADELKARRWDVLVLDEAHYIKSPTAVRTKTITGSRQTGAGILTVCDRIWALTGTPMPNTAADLWVACRAIIPGVARSLGITTEEAWLQKFTMRRETDWGTIPFRSINLDTLQRAMAPFMLRRKKSDVLKDLPAIRFDTWTVEADPALLKEARRTASKDDLAKLKVVFDGMGVSDEVGLDPLAMASVRRLTGKLKAPAVAALLVERLNANPGDKAIVFAVHREALDYLETALKAFMPVRVDGNVTGDHRQRAIDVFQTDPGCRVFVGQLQACSTAINLTEANLVVFAEASWVPAENEQALSRAHRLGNKRSVEVIYTCLEGSIDEAVTGVLIRKASEIRQFLAESKGRDSTLDEFDDL